MSRHCNRDGVAPIPKIRFLTPPSSPSQQLWGRTLIDLHSDRCSNCAELFLRTLHDCVLDFRHSHRKEIIVLQDLQENSIAASSNGVKALRELTVFPARSKAQESCFHCGYTTCLSLFLYKQNQQGVITLWISSAGWKSQTQSGSTQLVQYRLRRSEDLRRTKKP